MIYLLLLVVGLAIIAIGYFVSDEIYRLSAVITGTFILVWAFTLTPTPFQLLVEVIIFISVFFSCVRCWECQ
ncbi:MAG: hypothetical protein SAK29_13255 [Scytonema sp. PMC 1069.18]|nr:hypothetical protein [Scytonema sp. PMC 1069.18]MEC4886330.1 hypothetical protein [Scytonema sp. PMC 1070.18]